MKPHNYFTKSGFLHLLSQCSYLSRLSNSTVSGGGNSAALVKAAAAAAAAAASGQKKHSAPPLSIYPSSSQAEN